MSRMPLRLLLCYQALVLREGLLHEPIAPGWSSTKRLAENKRWWSNRIPHYCHFCIGSLYYTLQFTNSAGVLLTRRAPMTLSDYASDDSEASSCNNGLAHRSISLKMADFRAIKNSYYMMVGRTSYTNFFCLSWLPLSWCYRPYLVKLNRSISYFFLRIIFNTCSFSFNLKYSHNHRKGDFVKNWFREKPVSWKTDFMKNRFREKPISWKTGFVKNRFHTMDLRTGQ